MRQRGVYEKFPGSGAWWIRYADTMGRLRREKAGTKSDALTLYRKLKTEALQGKKLPESLRTPAVSFAKLAHDALVYSKAHKRTYQDDVLRMPWLLAAFRERAADSITPQDLERHFTRIEAERNWAPASVNRYCALVSLIFRLGIENGKVKENPARLVKHRRANNARTRWLSPEEEARLRIAIEARHHDMTVSYSHLSPAHTLAAVESLAKPSPEASTDTRIDTAANEQVQGGSAHVH
jgi:hypothetical protein